MEKDKEQFIFNEKLLTENLIKRDQLILNEKSLNEELNQIHN